MFLCHFLLFSLCCCLYYFWTQNLSDLFFIIFELKICRSFFFIIQFLHLFPRFLSEFNFMQLTICQITNASLNTHNSPTLISLTVVTTYTHSSYGCCFHLRTEWLFLVRTHTNFVLINIFGGYFSLLTSILF